MELINADNTTNDFSIARTSKFSGICFDLLLYFKKELLPSGSTELRTNVFVVRSFALFGELGEQVEHRVNFIGGI